MTTADWLVFALGLAGSLGKTGAEVWVAIQGQVPELEEIPWSEPAALAALDARAKRLAELQQKEP